MKACPIKCSSCTDPETCQDCKPGNYLLDKTCLSKKFLFSFQENNNYLQSLSNALQFVY